MFEWSQDGSRGRPSRTATVTRGLIGSTPCTPRGRGGARPSKALSWAHEATASAPTRRPYRSAGSSAAYESSPERTRPRISATRTSSVRRQYALAAR
jgi:hypothetical protein